MKKILATIDFIPSSYKTNAVVKWIWENYYRGRQLVRKRYRKSI